MKSQGKNASHARGVLGENAAAEALLRDGWTVVRRNYRARHGEIDLIAEKNGILAFVEVRARSAGSAVTPLETVDLRKRRRLVESARQFLLEFPEYRDYQPRFDIAEVILERGGGQVQEYRYLPSAFTLNDI